MIYLDHHSATPPCNAALERMTPYLQEHWGASFSPHRMGSELRSALDTRYQMIRDLVEAEERDRFVFTSSGFEAVHRVFWTVFLEVARKQGKTHFIISDLEDAPSVQCARRLEELGCTIRIAPEKEGQIDVEALEQLLSPRTALISVTMAHGLSGVVQPVEQIIELAREKKTLLHLDATYAMGKYPFKLESDYLTFSGDRIHSVKSSGGLFAKEKAPLILPEGISLDVPSLMALSAAAQQAMLYFDVMATEVARLRNRFESQIHGKVLYQDLLRLPNTSLIAFEKVHPEALLYFLNRKGICATVEGSYPAVRTEAVSFALSRMNTEEEILQSASIINETVRELQRISEAL